MAQEIQQKQRRWTPAAIGISALGHTLAVTIIFVAMVGVAVPLEAAASAVEFAWSIEHLREAVTIKIAIQLGLAICAWALLYIAFRSVDLGVLASKRPRVVRRARGTVITETLICMPVFLLLLFGMIQLSINNMAGILHQVASFQAARTVWVWEQEPGVTEAELKDRVRIAVALSMAPVAPGNYPTAYDDSLSPRAESTSQFMSARFESFIPGFSLPSFGSPDLTIPSGLDGDSSHASRAQSKFRHAYGSTQVNSVSSGADVTYMHFQSMPLVGRIFGESGGGQNVYYQRYDLDYSIPQQIYGVGRP
jgi:hypothetical protein